MNTRIFAVAAILCSFVFALMSDAQDAPLRTGDSIELRIGGVPAEDAAAVSGPYLVDNDGQINLSHIGKVAVAGRTAGQAADAIEAAYKSAQIYSSPTITINTQTIARFVNVGGEVKAPQRVPFTADLTVNSAISAAGGFTDYANRKKVRLLRGREVMIIDTKKIMGDPSLDVIVRPGDQIFVEQSFF